MMLQDEPEQAIARAVECVRDVRAAVQRWKLDSMRPGDLGLLVEGAEAWCDSVANRLAERAGQAEGAGETEAIAVLRELVEGEDHWTPERDEAFQAAKHRARALVASSGAGDEAASKGEQLARRNQKEIDE